MDLLTQAELSRRLKVYNSFRGQCAPPSHCFQQALDILEADRVKVVKLMVLDSKRIIEEKVLTKKKAKAG